MSSARSVRLVRLRGRREESIRRAVILLEDALRTASVPGLASSRRRVLFVRRLDLGAIQLAGGPTALSLAIERELGRIGAVVDPHDTSADGASAVGFADEVEPFVALALRLASGRNVDAWFWPLAVRGFSTSSPRGDSLRALVLALALGESGDVALPVLLEGARRLALVDAVFRTLHLDDGATLLAAVGWSTELARSTEFSGAEPASPWSPVSSASDSAWASIVARWVRVWGIDSPLSVWLARAVLVLDRPARRLDPALPANVGRWLRSVATANEFSPPAVAPDPDGEWPPADRFSRLSDSPEPALIVRPPSVDGREPTERSHNLAPTAPFAFGQTSAREPTKTSEESGPEELLPAYVPFSDDAGFFFLIPLLERLGVSGWLAENPAMIEWDFPRRFLAYAADRLGLEPKDPARAALSATVRASEPKAWSVPFEGRIGRAFSERRVLRSSSTPLSLRGWFLWCRRACLRWTGLPLRAVVRRRGGVNITRTHIDVTFSFRETETRIRRAGLDLDPGWVPWLGRVVLFYYE